MHDVLTLLLDMYIMAVSRNLILYGERKLHLLTEEIN